MTTKTDPNITLTAVREKGALRLAVTVDGTLLTYLHPSLKGRECLVEEGATAPKGTCWSHSGIWSLDWKVLTDQEQIWLEAALKLAEKVPVTSP